MSRKPVILCFVLCLGVGLHAGSLFFFHNLPLTRHFSSFHQTVSFFENTCALLKRQERTEFLKEFFNNIGEVKPEVKEKLFELKAEYAPAVEIAFLKEQQLKLSEEKTFALESNPLEVATEEEGDVILLKGTSLITQSAIVTSLAIPSRSGIVSEDDSCVCFGTPAAGQQSTLVM